MNKSQSRKEYNTFLQLLKDERERKGLTQIKLAHLLGETQSFISKCERGERRLDIVEARAFCKAIGLDFSKFAGNLNKLLG